MDNRDGLAGQVRIRLVSFFNNVLLLLGSVLPILILSCYCAQANGSDEHEENNVAGLVDEDRPPAPWRKAEERRVRKPNSRFVNDEL